MRSRSSQQPISLDSVRWLLLSLALILAPLAIHLKPWVPAFAVALGLWRHQLAMHRLPLPRLRVMLPLTLLAVGAVFASHGGNFGRDASVSLLAVMLGMKLLESKNRRDAMLVAFLAWFLGITSFLFSQSLFMGAYLALPTLALTLTLIGISHPNGKLQLRERLKLALRLLAQAVPVMLILFVLFPRLSGPLWRMPNDATNAYTGLSDSMSPGSIGELTLSDDIAFRVEFQGAPPPQDQLYWRGPVFWQFDGRTWRPGLSAARLPGESLSNATDPVTYTVTLEPHNRRWLFALDLAASAPDESTLSQDRQMLSRLPVTTRIRYPVRSFLRYALQPELDPETRRAALQLPARFNPRTQALGREWASSGENPEAISRRALQMFREQNFVYTLTPPMLGRDGVDEFLFSSQRGFCEHYASSYVMLMRAAGIPARVVTGYQGGQFNPLGNYMIVRQSDAHAWAEIWLDKRGWTRIDPTSAISPTRIEAGLSVATLDQEGVASAVRRGKSWLEQAYLGWDAINNGWNQWVLGYNQQRQIALFSRLLGNEISLREIAWGMIGGILLIMSAIGWSMLRVQAAKPDRLQRAYAKFVHKLGHAGIMRLPHEGPLAFGARAANALPEQADAITGIATKYASLRYGNAPAQQQLQQLEKTIKDFRI